MIIFTNRIQSSAQYFRCEWSSLGFYRMRCKQLIRLHCLECLAFATAYEFVVSSMIAMKITRRLQKSTKRCTADWRYNYVLVTSRKARMQTNHNEVLQKRRYYPQFSSYTTTQASRALLSKLISFLRFYQSARTTSVANWFPFIRMGRGTKCTGVSIFTFILDALTFEVST